MRQTVSGGLPKSAFPRVHRRRCRGRGEDRQCPLTDTNAAFRAQVGYASSVPRADSRSKDNGPRYGCNLLVG